jgi:hypothetical protein
MFSNGPVRVLLILKGASEPLSLDGMNGTEFTLIKFARKSGCAVFSFVDGRGANARTKTIILDCHCICSVVCLGADDIPPY